MNNPALDAHKVHKVLTQRYTFEPENAQLLTNPTRTQIIEAFDELQRKVKPNDNLLVFYAGHGLWSGDEKDAYNGTGFWLPTDAKKTSTANNLRNTTVQDYLAAIPAKHILVISDACFGGSLFRKTKSINIAPPDIEKQYALKSRKGMTAGNLKEVPDISIFTNQLVKTLQNNTAPYYSSYDLFTAIRKPVLSNTNNTPIHLPIQDTGDAAGYFIFIRR